MSDSDVDQCPMHRLSTEYNPFEPPQLDNPFVVWTEARHDAPVFFSEVLNGWIVTRYKDIDRIFRDPELFSSELDNRLTAYSPEVRAILDGIPDIEDTKAPRNDAPRHMRYRTYIQQSLTPRRLDAREDDIRALAHRLIDEMTTESSADFYTAFAAPFALGVMGIVLRLPTDQLEQIQAWVEADMIFRHGHPTVEQQLAGARAQRAFWELSVSLLEKRRVEPSDDFVTFAVQANDANEEPLTQREMVGQIVTVFLGGFETTANWLTMAVALLLEGDRERWTALCSDPDSVKKVVEETLRLRGSAQTNWRTPRADVEIDGVTIPAGSRVGVVPLSGNRDEEVFPNANEYDPGRSELNKHMAFGKGVHMCVGAPLTRQEGRIALAALAERLPDLELDTAMGDMHYLPNSMLVMARNLHLRWDSPLKQTK